MYYVITSRVSYSHIYVANLLLMQKSSDPGGQSSGNFESLALH